MIKGYIRKMNRLVQFVAMAFIVSACGGGGGGDNGAGFVPAQGAGINITLADENGTSITEISPLQAGLFKIAVTKPNGGSLAQAVVSAEVSIGRLQPDTGTALTDNDGIATLIVQPDGEDGAGTLTATVTYDGVDSSNSINYSITTSPPFRLDVEVVDENESAVSRIETGSRIVLAATLVDERTNSPVENQTITADIGNLGEISPPNGAIATDQSGQGQFAVLVGNEPGAYAVTVAAVVPGGSVTETLNLSVDQAVRKLGHIDIEGNFVEGVIGIVPDGELSPGGTAILNFAVVDEDLQFVTSEELLSITSSCLTGNLAVIDPGSPVIMGARIPVDYTAQGCTGEDLITARLASSGAEATGVVDVAEPTPSETTRITFETANPEIIALRGTGSASDIPEFSTLTFLVSDATSNPIPNAKVNFELAQSAGGLALECLNSTDCIYDTAEDAAQGRSKQSTTYSGFDGRAVAKVLAGAVVSPVQVVAYVDLNNNNMRDQGEPTTTSKTLVISTGIPDQNSVSLSASVLNVEGAFELDGKTSELTVRLADKFNNPAPDGTAAVFTTELGSIIGSCTTTGGSCSVTWTSQAPRSSGTVDAFSMPISIIENLDSSTPNRYDCPAHRENHGPCPVDIGDEMINPPGAPRGGRSTILVTANGEESFVDRNANGVYDEGELWTNMAEAFNDHNEDGVYTPSQRPNCESPNQADDVCLAGFEETFADRNSNGLFDLNDMPMAPAGSSLPDGVYNGVLCTTEQAETGVCSRELIDVRDSLVLVNAFSNADQYRIMLINRSSKREPSLLYENSWYDLYISDLFNNPPPPDTTVEFESSGDCEAVTETQPIPDLNKAGAFSTALIVSTADYAQSLEDALSGEPDSIKIKMTLPNGSFTTQIYSCYVYRCADDPSQFPQFSPAPPQCTASG